MATIIAAVMAVMCFIFLLGHHIGERRHLKQVKELKEENLALKQQLFEVIDKPDSIKSTLIKSAVRLNIATEKIIWR